MGLRTAAIGSRAGLVAAAIALASFSSGSAQAVPFAPAPGITGPADGDIVAAQYGWRRDDGYGHHRDEGHHRGWGHRHHAWGHHHDGWGHRRYDEGHHHHERRGFYRY